MKKIIENTLSIIGIILLIWVVLSYINVINNNMPWQEHNYWSWNFFEVIRKLAGR